MAVSAHDNFELEQIAAAIGMEAKATAKQSPLFEAAARWFRLNRASRSADL
jgi:hypothetical protein